MLQVVVGSSRGENACDIIYNFRLNFGSMVSLRLNWFCFTTSLDLNQSCVASHVKLHQITEDTHGILAILVRNH